MALGIFIGIIIGAFIGIALMCILQINRENKYYELSNAVKSLGNYIAIRVNQAERMERKDLSGMKEVQRIYNYYFEEELE